MGKKERLQNRVNRIDARFKEKVRKGKKGTDMDIATHEARIQRLADKGGFATPFMLKSPLNKNEFDIDYSGAEPVDLGNIPASDFTKAKKKLVEGYGGVDNPQYQMEKAAYFYDKKKGKMRSSYLEYPEDAGDIEPRYLGKNWDN